MIETIKEGKRLLYQDLGVGSGNKYGGTHAESASIEIAATGQIRDGLGGTPALHQRGVRIDSLLVQGDMGLRIELLAGKAGR